MAEPDQRPFVFGQAPLRSARLVGISLVIWISTYSSPVADLAYRHNGTQNNSSISEYATTTGVPRQTPRPSCNRDRLTPILVADYGGEVFADLDKCSGLRSCCNSELHNDALQLSTERALLVAMHRHLIGGLSTPSVAYR